MANFLPIYLDLRQRSVLVVGGGRIATGKVRELLSAEARVTVIAPDASADIQHAHANGALVWHKRDFVDGDIGEHFMVISATDHKALNAHVYQLANARQRIANAVDDLENCNFIAPAVARRGPLQVAVSTSGTSPALAKQLRDHIQHVLLTEDAARLAEFLGAWRPAVKSVIPTYARRQAFWEGLLESCAPELISTGQTAAVETVMNEFLTRSHHGTRATANCAAFADKPAHCRACFGV